jgi:hypothetical protein
MVAVRARSSTIAYTTRTGNTCIHAQLLKHDQSTLWLMPSRWCICCCCCCGLCTPRVARSGKPTATHLGRSSQRQEGAQVDILDCLWYQHLRRTICVRYNIYVLQQLSSRLLLLSKHCSSAVCRPAAGAAAHLPKKDGMTSVQDQRVSAVGYDVAWCTARHSGTC